MGAFAAIVPAAGSGSRMGGAPKQFRRLGDAPVLVQSLQALKGVVAVNGMVVVAPPDALDETRGVLGDYELAEVRVVAGGATRQASVRNGLDAISSETGAVLVHDAARPFLSLKRLRTVAEAVLAHGAAALAVPVADTLRRAEGTFGETVDREGLWRMQTPQGARLDWLRDAHARFGTASGTDEVELLKRAGYPVQVVEGDPVNVKLTRPSDWAFAEMFWPVWAARHRS